jgi:PTS system ascorbate-specific IIA component
MIGILILAQKDTGKGFIHAAEHVLGQRPPQIDALPVNYDQPPEQLAQSLQQYIAKLDQGQGVLILADVYGATHTNVACRFLKKNHVELIAGLNLPMLIRILNYRNLDFPGLINKALSGGAEGIVLATQGPKIAEIR